MASVVQDGGEDEKSWQGKAKQGKKQPTKNISHSRNGPLIERTQITKTW